MLGFIVISAISGFLAFNSSEAIFENIKTFNIFFYFLLLLISLRMENLQKDIIIKALLINTFILLVIGSYQLIIRQAEGRFATDYEEISSTVANKNLFSSILFLSMPVSLQCIFKYRKIWKIIGLLVLILSLYFIVILLSRAVFLATGIFIAIFAFMNIVNYRRNKLSYNINKILLYTSIIIVSLCLLLFLFKGALSMTGLSTYSDTIGCKINQVSGLIKNIGEKSGKMDPPSSASVRFVLISKSYNMFKEYPLLGVGPGNWKIYLPAYGLADLNYDVQQGMKHYQRPHNDFVWVLSETGITGFLFYISIFIITFIYALKIFNNKQTNNDLQFFSVSCMSCFAGYIAISFFDFPKERIIHNVFFFSQIALLASCIPSNPFPLKKNGTILFLIICAIVSMFSINVLIFRIRGELHSHKMIVCQVLNKWNILISETEKAKNKYYEIDPFSTPLEWYKGVALFSMNETKSALIAFQTAKKLHPWHIHVLNNIGSCNEVLGNHQAAIDYYNKALYISPFFEETLVNLAIVYYNQNMPDQAYETIRKCKTDCTIPNFKKILNLILKYKSGILLQKTGSSLNEKINEDKLQEKLFELYCISLSNNTDFEDESKKYLTTPGNLKKNKTP